MEAMLLLSLKPDISLRECSEERLSLYAPFVSLPDTSLTLKKPSPSVLSSIDQLLNGKIDERELSTQVLQADGVGGLHKFNLFLRKMAERGMLCYSVGLDHEPWASLIPLTTYFRFAPDLVDPERKYVLSRFAHCRRDQDDMVLETPLSYAQVRLLHGNTLSVISELVHPRDCGEISKLLGKASEDLAGMLLNLLLNAQAIMGVQEDGSILEDTDPALTHWEFHDLLFHTRSRLGRHNTPFGKTFRFEGKLDPLPAIKPRVSDEVIPLYQPDLEQLKQTDSSFTHVLEERRSLRSFADQPITDRQLGEFLYRAARVKWEFDDGKGGVTFRQSPSGGALHSLEIYPVIDSCENIPPGLYHYDPKEHELCKITDTNWYTKALLEMAWHMIAEESRPQVLFEITSRFQRVQWKYSSIAYSVILKDVGCLYQTMNLVAEAMGLAGCALGGGHSDLSSQALGLNYYTESSVGGFVLGTRGEKSSWVLEHLE